MTEHLPKSVEELIARGEIRTQKTGRPTAIDKPPPKPKPSWRDHVITLAELQKKTFKPVKAVIPGLIVEGLNLLVSRPKLGKSWMIYDICIAITANRFTLGDIKPPQGDALYLSLEDSERRLQGRADKLLPTFSGEWPIRMKIATSWRRLDDGCIEDMAAWCDSVQDPVLIVVDIFAKVRPANPPKGKSQYDIDYDAVSKLQKFAISRGIAVVLIHHDRKMGADDPFDTVSGTYGVTGPADTILILKRTAAGVILYARGRDIEESEQAVQFNKATCRWAILGQAAEVHRSDERSRVIEALKNAGGPLSPNDIMIRADLVTRNATDILLGKMAANGEIERVGRGQYALPIPPQTDRKDQTDWKDRTDRTDPAVEPQSVRGSFRSNPSDRSAESKNSDKSTGLAANLSNLSDLSVHSAPALGPPGDSLDDFK